MVQGLGQKALTAEGLGSIPGLRNRIPQTVCRGQKKKKIRNLLPLECIPFNVVYHFPLVVLDFVCIFGF